MSERMNEWMNGNWIQNTNGRYLPTFVRSKIKVESHTICDNQYKLQSWNEKKWAMIQNKTRLNLTQMKLG